MALEKIEPNLYRKDLNGGGWTYYIKAWVGGRTITRSCRTQSIRAARQQLRKLQEDAARGRAPHARSDRTVHSFFEELEKSWDRGGVRAVTATDYKKRYSRHVKPRWGDTPIQAIRTRAVQRWIDDLGKGKSAATCSRVLTVLSLICKEAEKSDFLPGGNPCRDIEIRPDVPREITPLTDKQVTDFVAWVRKTRRSGDMRALQVGILARLGLRRAELCGLKIEDFSREGGRLYVTVRRSVTRQKGVLQVNPPKTARGRRKIPIWSGLGREIEQYISEHKNSEGWLFPSVTRPTEPLCPAAFSQALDRVVEAYRKAGGDLPPEFRAAHDLRHTCASALIARGGDPEQVSRFLGHRDAGITLRVYTHLFPGSLENLVE
ncbi:hypothetical protein CRD17_01320 [Corynebacterium sp. LK30]|uniref:tyrosine-type recombinase/integrase n=1 Tax=Corynebacterium sp. LK30 TaxID=2044577 RepID=UPI00165291D5|nr:site-specific integrase [Corynebacterium sp. LK30]MBC6805857.1 hypothetical protein [Corynebacterium sp. LK30]